MGTNSTKDAVGDKALVTAFQSGDADAYDLIYRRFSERVRHTCLRILHDPQDADEATQETFLRAYQALGRFNGSYQLGAWLARIAANVSIDQLRAKSRGARLVALPSDEDVVEVEDGPEDIVVGDHPRVTEALSDIRPLHATALHLRAVEGLSHQEMAGRLAMTPSQVKALLHRARRSFRRAWDRAEGWALAPVVAFRSMLPSRSSAPDLGAAPGLAVWGSTHMPALMERAVASAMLVAVALGGLGSSPASRTSDPGANDRAKVIVSAPGEFERRTPRATSASEAPASRPAERSLVKDLEAAVASAEEIVKAPAKALRSDKKRRPARQNEGDGTGPSSSESEKQKLERKVRRVLRELPESNPQLAGN